MTKCYTFYSYKGGSGRSTTSINTVKHLIDELGACKDHPILLVDSDLESAGLTYFFECEKKFTGRMPFPLHTTHLFSAASSALKGDNGDRLFGTEDPDARSPVAKQRYIYETLANKYDRALVDSALEGLELLTCEITNLKRIVECCVTGSTAMMGKVDHSEDHRIEDAKKVVKVWVETSDYAAVREVAAPLGIRSPYKATAIVRRYNGPQELDLELNTITIGEELAFITAPNELFDTISVMVEEGSPYGQTLTLGYCNAYRGYIPSKFGYEYTCYESDATWFEPGIGEQIAEQFISMLKEMKG